MTSEKHTAELYKKQISLSEWFESIDHKDSDKLRIEDNEKRERLRVLNELIDLPYDKPTQFSIFDLKDKSPEFVKYLVDHGDDLCALRLIPLEEGVPKLRMRGLSIRDVYKNWFPKQNIDPNKYRAEFITHSEKQFWSTIFIVNEMGIYGEIIEGKHQFLTQGFYPKTRPIMFSFDFSEWKLDQENPEAQAHLNKLIDHLKVSNKEVQTQIIQKLDAKFANDYLCGYFETVCSEFNGKVIIEFVDYNRIISELYANFKITPSNNGDLTGNIGSEGYAKGNVKIINDPLKAELSEGDILVCDMTTPEYVPLMKKAGAIITNRGGILCHAAIIARELKKPCIIGTKNATKILKDNDLIEVDANKGSIKILQKIN